MTVVLAAAAAALFGCGTFLLLQRQLSRILVGLALLSHGANLVILVSAGGRAQPTFLSDGRDDGGLLDPLPQAFVLTAIVITFGVTCFLLALAYRSWALTSDDEVQDDVEEGLRVTERYLLLSEPERFLWDGMDGHTSLQDLATAYVLRYGEFDFDVSVISTGGELDVLITRTNQAGSVRFDKSVLHVVGDRAVEHEVVLEDHPQLRAVVAHAHRRQIAPIHEHPPRQTSA